MRLISHRGNIIGPNPNRENTPSYIDCAIGGSYDVEVDISYINDKFYLGHDEPNIEISETWMLKRKDNIWFHCKNISAAAKLSEMGNFKYFCHTNDQFSLISTSHIWVHDLNLKLDHKCVIPLLCHADVKNYNGEFVYAICTDYISFAKNHLKQIGL